jgi:hypothetical protein
MFDIQQQVFDDGYDEDKVHDYINGLMDEFAASPEAKPWLDAGRQLGYAGMMMEYGLNYPGVTPAKMSLADFNEVVFNLFPRKVSTEAEEAPAIIEELAAFWQFIERQYGLRNAAQIRATLNASAVERLRKKLADPSNFGMAKSLVMAGWKAGFDMTTQEGTQQFMEVYNRQLQGGVGPPSLPLDPGDFSEPWLLVERPSRDEREKKRAARKRQRQARKRNRR